ncbi:unnamed protein product [Pleuronectes platessa]|uniref:Uncharacterized protein n=1 Tax=Pleuronectes platessa TaxID=8262 RepID=A0A9N7YK91_PLEPL|nr:unnamed protein product [Pleuronectes platessa]
MGPGQVISDVDPEELEAADSLHRGPVDGEGGVFHSLSLPVVHDQLLRFADVEMEVVVLAPRCQGSDLLSVGLLIVAGDQAYDSDISKLNVATQSCVNRDEWQDDSSINPRICSHPISVKKRHANKPLSMKRKKLRLIEAMLPQQKRLSRAIEEMCRGFFEPCSCRSV